MKWKRALDELQRRLEACPKPRARPRTAKPERVEPDDSLDALLGLADDGGESTTPGAAYLFPLDQKGWFGVCRVLRMATAADLDGTLWRDEPPARREAMAGLLCLVATTPWIGRKPPSLDEPLLRQVLVLTHGAWGGSPQVVLVGRRPEPGLRLLGAIPASRAERRLRGVSCNMWVEQEQPYLQYAWDQVTAGPTHLVPLAQGTFGVCRVLRPATRHDLHAPNSAFDRDRLAQSRWVVAMTEWRGARPPRRLDDPRLRRLDHAGMRAVPNRAPRTWKLLGHIPSTPDEQALRANGAGEWKELAAAAR